MIEIIFMWILFWIITFGEGLMLFGVIGITFLHPIENGAIVLLTVSAIVSTIVCLSLLKWGPIGEPWE